MNNEERCCLYCLHIGCPKSEEPCKSCNDHEKFESKDEQIDEKLGILGGMKG